MSRKLEAKVDCDFSLKGSELADDSEGMTNSLERDADREKYMLAERCESVKNAFAALKKAMPSGKHRDCLVARIKQLKDDSLELTTMMDCSCQHVHSIKKAICS